jgi:hypothetical protein
MVLAMRSVALFLLASAVYGQNAGSISGRISDYDNNAQSKAEIQARNTATGATFTAKSNATGDFTLERLPAGTYQLTASAPGFLPYERKNVAVQSGETLRLDILLEDIQLSTLGEGRGSDGKPLAAPGAKPEPAPRMPDGKPDLSGVWLRASMREFGKPELLAWAAATVKERNENNHRDIPSAHCLPLGATMSTLLFPYKLAQTPKLLVMIFEGEPSRQIFLDGRAHPSDPFPSFLGHSVGHWEDDTLVVDTVGFNGKTWADFTGRPTTEKLHLTERFRRPDLAHLENEITVDDPGAYTKPWSMKNVSELARDYELMEYICNENERDRDHIPGK